MFVLVIILNSNWETLTKNLVTFKRWIGLRRKTFDIFEVLLKYPIFRRESQKINMEGGLTKKGDWAVGNRGRGLGKKEGGCF